MLTARPGLSIFRRITGFRLGGALLFVCLALRATAQETSVPPSSGLPLLTTVQQILDLGLDAPTRALFPVRLEGRVTYPDPHANMIYIQDSSAGIRVNYTNFNFQPAPGEIVVVEGTVSAGMFAPYIDCSSIKRQRREWQPENFPVNGSRWKA